MALDQWLINKTKTLQAEIISAYDNYEFHLVSQKLHHFCSLDLGSFYLDVIKDRQYTCKTDSVARRSAQTALYHVAQAMLRWLAPILSFTAEEAWKYLPGQHAESVFFTQWYENFPDVSQSLLSEKDWEQIIKLREAVNKSIETLRNQNLVGSSLEAEVTLYVNSEWMTLLNQFQNELRFILLTSTAKLLPLEQAIENAVDVSVEGLKLMVTPSTYIKCARCWHRREDVGQNAAHPTLCLRCVENVDGSGEVRRFA